MAIVNQQPAEILSARKSNLRAGLAWRLRAKHETYQLAAAPDSSAPRAAGMKPAFPVKAASESKGDGADHSSL
jgi:hypothetical protein